MEIERITLIMIPEVELKMLQSTQQEILNYLKKIPTVSQGILIKNIPAKEFMAAVNIKRTKFDELVKSSKIKVIKKKRKIYVPATEIERYFNDPAIG